MTKLLIWLSVTATEKYRHQFVIPLEQLGLQIDIDHVDTDLIADELSKRCKQIITKMAITAGIQDKTRLVWHVRRR